jgi:hypothetical protein
MVPKRGDVVSVCMGYPGADPKTAKRVLGLIIISITDDSVSSMQKCTVVLALMAESCKFETFIWRSVDKIVSSYTAENVLQESK